MTAKFFRIRHIPWKKPDDGQNILCAIDKANTGRAEVQVNAFLKNVVNPILEENKELLGVKAEINV